MERIDDDRTLPVLDMTSDLEVIVAEFLLNSRSPCG